MLLKADILFTISYTGQQHSKNMPTPSEDAALDPHMSIRAKNKIFGSLCENIRPSAAPSIITPLTVLLDK